MPALSDSIDAPSARIRPLVDAPVRPNANYVLYWMTSARRLEYNFALQRARAYAASLKKPLLIFEALSATYPWASARLHSFVIDGMAANLSAAARAGVTYLPYMEPTPGDGKGLLLRLAQDAAVIVTDDFPCFFLPKLVSAAAQQLRHGAPRRFEAVDSCGLLPLRAAPRAFPVARSFRTYWHRTLHLHAPPLELPLAGYAQGHAQVPTEVMTRWALQPQLASKNALLASLSFKSHVAPVPILGGTKNGKTRLNAFVSERLGHYGVARNHPDEDGSSGLSPYLHFGHLSPQHVLASVINHELQTTTLLPPTEDEPGTSSLPLHSSSAVNFVDQLITWRELGFNFCAHRPDYAALSSLPAWALATIKAHASDVRPITYSLAQFESAETHDAIWNAAQRQLLKDGVMHNYLRMLWGKKIYEWSTSAAEALETMIHLNNKYALDGRDPNSYSGIFWTLGRYDRAWGPERPIFGKLRYMTSDSTRKKLRLRRYLERYGPGLSLFSGCAVFWMQFLGGLASG